MEAGYRGTSSAIRQTFIRERRESAAARGRRPDAPASEPVDLWINQTAPFGGAVTVVQGYHSYTGGLGVSNRA